MEDSSQVSKCVLFLLSSKKIEIWFWQSSYFSRLTPIAITQTNHMNSILILAALNANLRRSRVFKHLEFRRVQYTKVDDSHLTEVVVHHPDGTCTIYTPDEFQQQNFSDSDEEHFVERRYSQFTSFTTDRSQRDHSSGQTSKWDGRQIHLRSGAYAPFSLEKLQFDTSDASRRTKVPCPRAARPNPDNAKQTLPGDLIACIPVEPAHSGQLPTARFWCPVSEQFLRMWTAVMFNSHRSLSKRNGDLPEAEMHWLMGGNRLTTNSHRKWTLSHKHNDVEADEEESKKRFFYIRTEEASRRWCHVYAAIVLMARYGQLPSGSNLPTNRGPNDLNMNTWDLPEGFVVKFLAKHGVVADEAMASQIESMSAQKRVVEEAISHEESNLEDLVERINSYISTTTTPETLTVTDSNFPSL